MMMRSWPTTPTPKSLTLFPSLKAVTGNSARENALGMNYFSSTCMSAVIQDVYRIEADRNAAYEVENDGRSA